MEIFKLNNRSIDSSASDKMSEVLRYRLVEYTEEIGRRNPKTGSNDVIQHITPYAWLANLEAALAARKNSLDIRAWNSSYGTASDDGLWIEDSTGKVVKGFRPNHLIWGSY